MSDRIPMLGSLSPVSLRDVWPSEPYSFTPWLALPDNLNALALALELPEFELIQTEQQVSEFSVDIVARIAGTEDVVVIENQLERTDHSHLGQALTYAAGSQARAIIWVAQSFAEGHRAALDWLNQMTSEDIGFFGVEIQAWRIGDSAPAPRFNVVVKPNNWARLVREVSSAPSPDAAKNIAYWTAFNELADQMGLRNNPGRAARGTNVSVQLLKGDIGSVYSCGYIARSGTPEIGAYLYLQPAEADVMAQWRAKLEAALPDLQSRFGEPIRLLQRTERLCWLHLSTPANPDEAEDWPRQHQWLVSHMQKFKSLWDEKVLSLLDIPDL